MIESYRYDLYGPGLITDPFEGSAYDDANRTLAITVTPQQKHYPHIDDDQQAAARRYRRARSSLFHESNVR